MQSLWTLPLSLTHIHVETHMRAQTHFDAYIKWSTKLSDISSSSTIYELFC